MGSYCDYSVEYDIIYDNENRNCHFNDERKSAFDLYTPKSVCKQISKEKIPIVLFVHGGGWRRGDKSAWKYYVGRDINLMVALMCSLFGLYGNVGRALAKRGIACAVMSYPLTKLSNAWLLLEMTTSYIASFLILSVSIAILSIASWILWTFMVWRDFNDLFDQKLDLLSIILVFMLLTNLFILGIISIQGTYHKLSLFHIGTIWITLVCLVILLPKKYVFLFETVVTFIISQAILLHTNLKVQTLSLDQQVESVVKCIKRVKHIGQEKNCFNSDDFYLMGHSAGGHLCSTAALSSQYLKDQGLSAVDIKGVITISPVLQISRMDTTFVRPLYLHPTFGKTPEKWMKRCPSQSLLEQTESDNYIPPFLIVIAEKDITLIKDGASEFHNEINRLSRSISDYIVVPKTNHTSIMCYFDKTFNSLNLADLCCDFIKKCAT